MEGWPYTASCLAWLGYSGPAGEICTVMDGPYRLPCWTVPSALSGAAQLQSDGISSCCYIVNVHNRPLWPKSRMAGQGEWVSMLIAPWARIFKRLWSLEPRNRFQRINSASLCSQAGRYDNPIPTRFLASIDCLKIPALIHLFNWEVKDDLSFTPLLFSLAQSTVHASSSSS